MRSPANTDVEPPRAASCLLCEADASCAGIIDDIYGANFVNGGKDGNVQDQNGHGSFVAGVVGAVGNNGLGVTGINQVSRAQLLAVFCPALLASAPCFYTCCSSH